MTLPHELLERKIGEWMGFEPANVVACASGTAALHLALEALMVDGRCLVPEFTMIACARAASLADCPPVFVDCDERLGLSCSRIRHPLSRITAAIMPVHIYGRRCSMSLIHNLARQNNLLVVEDLAEAHGVVPHPNTDAACWSFYKNKIVAGEEGGAIAFKNRDRADHARSLRSLGFTDDHDFLHIPRGHNYRLSDVHTELIIRSLVQIKVNLKLRAEIASWYEEYLPVEFIMPPRDVNWVYDLRIPGMDFDRQTKVIKALHVNGIRARHAFKPMSMQEEYQRSSEYVEGLTAYRMSQEVIYLPVHSEIRKVDCNHAVNTLLRALEYNS